MESLLQNERSSESDATCPDGGDLTQLCSYRNPMLNPVVLASLFELCDLSDLPRFRLVSREWYSISLTHFRKEMWAVIHYCKNTWTPNCLNWESSLKDDLDLGRKPFRNFRIMRVEFYRPYKQRWGIKYKNMGQFWGKYGQWIHKLHIYSAEIHSMEFFQRAIFEETPNLEELHLGRIIDKRREKLRQSEKCLKMKLQPNLKILFVKMWEALPISWEVLFNHFPNIQKLIVAGSDSGADTRWFLYDQETHLQEISDLLKRKAMEHTKVIVPELSWNLRTSDEIHAATRTLLIPLLSLPKLSLDFKFHSGDEEVQLVSTAFLLHGHALESLCLSSRRVSPYENFPFHPGPFNFCSTLDLSGNCCRDLHFLENFPNLKILKLGGWDSEILFKTDSARMEQIRLLKMTELRLDLCFVNQKYISEEVMEMLVSTMPNVNIFHGNLSNSSLRVVCREWKQLRELRIVPFSSAQEWFIDDEGITGQVAGSGEYEDRMPNITDLKELKYLTIQRGQRIGNASIRNGFLKLPQLEQLNVELSSEISEVAFAALTKRFPRVSNKIIRLLRA